MAIRKGARTHKRETRPVATERAPIICQLGGDGSTNSSNALRLQYLAARFALQPTSLALTIADLAFGGAA